MFYMFTSEEIVDPQIGLFDGLFDGKTVRKLREIG